MPDRFVPSGTEVVRSGEEMVMSTPQARENLPMGGLLWKEVAGRLGTERICWLHTTSPEGVPNATPVWCVELRDVLYFYTHSRTVKARNLERNPIVAVHLESGSDVLIVQGRLLYLGHPSQHPDVIELFDKKYDQPEERPFLPLADPIFDLLYSLEPMRAVAWNLPDSDASTRRWTSGDLF
jgi:Pyridoxamine 5'-phosphate oxidase